MIYYFASQSHPLPHQFRTNNVSLIPFRPNGIFYPKDGYIISISIVPFRLKKWFLKNFIVIFMYLIYILPFLSLRRAIFWLPVQFTELWIWMASAVQQKFSRPRTNNRKVRYFSFHGAFYGTFFHRTFH